jgi:hypothetical protein
MSVSFNSNTKGNNSGAGTAYPSRTPEIIPGFCGVRVARSLVFCVVFCRSLFVLLSFFDLRILITPLVSSKSSNLRSVGFSHFPTCFLTYSPGSYDKYIYKRLTCSTTTSTHMLKYNKNNYKSTKRL